MKNEHKTEICFRLMRDKIPHLFVATNIGGGKIHHEYPILLIQQKDFLGFKYPQMCDCSEHHKSPIEKNKKDKIINLW